MTSISDIHSDITTPDEGPLLARSPMRDEAHFDITAMIDLVFMMNIYFLVTSLASAMSELDLPPAEFGKAAEMEGATVVTLIADGDQPAKIYLGDGPQGEPQTEEGIRDAIELAEHRNEEGKKVVIIKAERHVYHRDVVRLAGTIGAEENIDLNVAVLEFE